MALRLEYVKKLKLPSKPMSRGIDNFMLKELIKRTKLRANDIVFYDSTIDTKNWTQSLDTDGYNNISLNRSKWYTNTRVPWCIPVKKTFLNIPPYIMKRLQVLKK